MRLAVLRLVHSILAAGILQVAVRAQPAGRPEFEVASIKPSRFSSTGAVAIGAQSAPGTVTLTGIKLRDLIARAYSLQPYQIVGPGRLDDEYYDIVAKSAQPVSDADQRRMLQSLLASRFGLAAHRETKEIPSYELVVEKGGLKMKARAADDPLPPRFYPGAATAIRAQSISMKYLADLLTPKTDRPVLDRSGVSGVFDVDLKWTTDFAAEPGPSLFTALQEQLGLRLQASKSTIETLVVEHLDKPSEN